ncbi:MAG: hypothetical protein KC502_16705 [Myxococcales bacterium]|nr:hypothetical protein [Myxococcales bacterium]
MNAARTLTCRPSLRLCAALSGLVLVGCGGDKPGDKDSADSLLVPSFDVQSEVGPGQDTGPSSDAPAPDSTAPDKDTGIDVGFPVTDGACKAQCTGKVCGPDGCGAVCGFCPSGKVCATDGSACEVFCKPDCSAKKCGDNGCGGSCGDCPKDYNCGVDFLCHENDCTASCTLAGGTKKVCGGDGCGGSCGSCAEGDVCADALGTCSATACKGIAAVGKCDSDLLLQCEGSGATGKKKVTDCGAQLPKGSKICGYDSVAGVYACIKKTACVPSCKTLAGKDKFCGSDGCDGICGKCTKGWACPDGDCVPAAGAACGTLPAAGQCDGKKWLFCSTGIIQALDCNKAGQTCGWIAAAKTFGCK